MVAQTVLPPRFAALDWLADRELSAEEESEPAKSSGEEKLAQLCGTSSSRIRRPEAALWQRLVSVCVPVAQRPIVRSLRPVEFAARNGTGGPLRC
jgi:hypothetical protein